MMCNLYVLFGMCLLLPLLVLGDSSKSSEETELTTPVPGQHLVEAVNNSSQINGTLPAAEKLIRFRRHPSYALRHGSKRSKRRRVKGPPPKIRYGPPNHPPGPPISYTHYKPHSLPPSFPTHIEEPSYSIDDFQHLKFDATDFHIPASSYEAQSMDLNLYSHEDNDIYGAHKFPSLEYTFTEDHHESPPPPPPSSYEHTPHQKYGVPPLQQSIGPSSYEPESYVEHHYVPPPPPSHAAHPPPSTHYGAPANPPSTHYGAPPSAPPSSHYGVPAAPPSSHYGAPAAPPSTQYGVPSAPAHLPSYSHSAPPPAPPPDSYSIYEQKIPNSGYNEHSFAEPPKSSPPAHNSNYEIAYSPPAYEISTSYQAHDTQYEQNYQPPSSSHDGHFAEPPPPPPQHAPAPPQYTPQQPAHQPPQHPPQHAPQPPQQHPASNYVLPEQHAPVQSYPQDDYALPSEELPLNPNPKFPSFDFPKSSYEVPIYDPIPFESSNKEEQESYPPILPDHTSNDLPSDAHAAGSSQTTTRSRKRKRRPSVVSKKHTLDVPELQQAYDADSHVHVVRGTDADTVAHGSHYVQHKRTYSNYVTPTTTTTTTTTTTPAPWSPMRHRTTPSSSSFIPTIITSTASPNRNRNRGTSRYRSRTASTEPTAVTIEKSRSQSYYDGTIAPPTSYQQQQQQQSQYYGSGGRGSSSSRPTRPPLLRASTGASLALQPAATERNPGQKRTTKGVFDTTLFKSPQSDRELERKLSILRQNLPKNHKLY